MIYMTKRTFIKEIKTWMKKHHLKRKVTYVPDDGEFLHWVIQSKFNGHFIDFVAKRDFNLDDGERIVLKMKRMKRLGEIIYSLEAGTTETILLPFKN